MEVIIGGLIVIASVFYILKGVFSVLSTPEVGDSFTCSSCGSRVKHNSRTISAGKMGR